tara:strand:- start:3128 stop:3583 length:456 start_codon:yes stop_codon:yes gene_type:complete
MQTKDKGTVSEMTTALELLKLGCTVSMPIGDNAPYDLLIDNGDVIIKGQCKTGKLRGGVIRTTLARSRRNATSSGKTYYSKDDIDYFFIYCPDTQKVYMIHVDDAGKDNIKLRVEVAKCPNKNIRIASEYELEYVWKHAKPSSSVVRAPSL